MTSEKLKILMKTPFSSIHGYVIILSLHSLLSFVGEYDYADHCLLTKCKGGIFLPLELQLSCHIFKVLINKIIENFVGKF